MLRYMKEDIKIFITYLVSVPCAAISSALFALNLDPLMDVVYTRDMRAFTKYALLQCLLVFLDMGASYCHKICREKMRANYVAGLKRDIFNGLFERDIAKFNGTSISTYVSIINRDVQKLNAYHFDSVCGFYRVIVSFIINLIIVICINPIVALINVLISFASVFVPKFFEKEMIRRQEISSNNSEEYYGKLKDYLNGFSTIKLFYIKDIIRDKMEQTNRKLEKSNYESVAINYTSAWVSMFCSQLSFVLTIIIGIWFAFQGTMSVGSVVAISQLIGGIAVPFEELPEYLSNYKSVHGIVDKIKAMISEKEKDIDKKKEIEVNKCTFKATDVEFTYEEDKPLIQNVSFELKQNKKYIMVGGSGSGKSTLAKLLMGFYPCVEGNVLFDEREIGMYSEKQYYRMVTYLEQSIFLFDDTLENNITLYQEYSKEEIDRAIQLSGLAQFVNELNDGIKTKIKENGQNFSGGEKQRIGIARALISGAKFLILDEVTASLDPILAADIENTIMNLPDTGVLLITHKWSEKLLRKSDEIFVMKNGQLVEQGNFEKLMNDKKYFYSYYYNI